jgi:hypothetical protein
MQTLCPPNPNELFKAKFASLASLNGRFLATLT